MGEHDHDFDHRVDRLLKNTNEPSPIYWSCPEDQQLGGGRRVAESPELDCTPATLRDHPLLGESPACYSRPLLPSLS